MSNLNPNAKNDFEILLGEATPLAEHFLQKNKEFYPYALTINGEGKPVLLAADPSKGERPDSKDVISLLTEGLKQEGSRAVCLAYMISLPDATDAVAIDFDHQDGSKMQFVLPYSFKKISKKLVLGNPSFQEGTKSLLS